MAFPRQRQHGESKVSYDLLENGSSLSSKSRRKPWARQHPRLLTIWVLCALLVFYLNLPALTWPPRSTCDRVNLGYICEPQISHFWGQYSPFFSVPSVIPPETPPQCRVDFVQVLSRHGARYPTASKTAVYNATIKKIHQNAKQYPGPYAFLADYKYTLGADNLTTFGEQEMVNSGVKFYLKYKDLARNNTPFVRAAGQTRVIDSAERFVQGFNEAYENDEGMAPPASNYPFVIIPEGNGSNNTLDHGNCPVFESAANGEVSDQAQAEWMNIFVPPIQARVNSALQGANLTITEIVNVMDLCPFNTVAPSSSNGAPSQFCALFKETEWHQYDYLQTLGKYYGYSYGNPLGPTQGVGYVNELIARLTNQPVHDETSTNHTLDDSPLTFPLGLPLYADFSHDNDITAIFSAIGLYNGTAQLPTTKIVDADEANGYSAAWTVSFGARAYFERLSCLDQAEQQIRVIVNDRVLPLTQCGGDLLGRCTLSAFIDSLQFASSGGLWADCFTGE